MKLIIELNKYTMNIQDKMQEIHHKYGVTEKANYEIQLFVDDLIKKDRAEQLILHGVSQQRKLLLAYDQHCYKTLGIDEPEGDKLMIEDFLANNCG